MSASDIAWAWPWWATMVLINFANLIVCAILFQRSFRPFDGKDMKYRRWMRVMGIIFTAVGAYRSIFVSDYGPQRAWFDTPANGALLIRLFAIFAELSFSGLIAYSMVKFNQFLPASRDGQPSQITSIFTQKSPYILVGCIFVAQFFATSGVITKSDFLFAIEETLWLIGFVAILPLAILQARRVFAIKDPTEAARLVMLRRSAVIILMWCAVYIGFGLFLNLPALWPSAIEQMQSGAPAIQTGWSAVTAAFTDVSVSRVYGDWGFGFLFWHSGYFSLCVWISLYLMQAPRPRENSVPKSRKITRLIWIGITIALVALLVQVLLPFFS